MAPPDHPSDETKWRTRQMRTREEEEDCSWITNAVLSRRFHLYQDETVLMKGNRWPLRPVNEQGATKKREPCGAMNGRDVTRSTKGTVQTVPPCFGLGAVRSHLIA